MSGSKSTKKLYPGDLWLSMPYESQIFFLKGLISGLNQGLRHCASEACFALITRVSTGDSGKNLALESVIQQMRSWSKGEVTCFKFSKAAKAYVQSISLFYAKHPDYRELDPSYLLIYMDDKHGMDHEQLWAFHERSLSSFKA